MNNSLWEKRYRYLEQNVEQMLTALDRKNQTSRTKKGLIQSLSFIKWNQSDVVLCIAEGRHLLYKFEFLSQEGETLFLTELDHVNISPAFPVSDVKIAKCVVTVRATDEEGSISAQEEILYANLPTNI